jgi:hypothetical protein
MNGQSIRERRGIGVVIPTRNSAAFLPRHLEQIRSWVDLAEEVIVVDSESTDETLSILRAGLTHQNLRILQHPPGLYPSWNFAVQHLSAAWTYISTVGDTIERNHLVHLLESAEALQCDVICSAPRFTHLGRDGEDLGNSPACVICKELRLTGPTLLSPRETLAYALRFALVHGLNTPVGSSASNLYCTGTLKKFPFPANYGSAGDAFWLLENAAHVRYGITPISGSTYLIHPSQHAPSNHHRKRDLNQCAAEIGFAGLAQLASGTSESIAIDDLIAAICSVGAQLGLAQHTLDSLKNSRLGKLCAIGPQGWLARWKRKGLKKKLHSIEASLVRQIALERQDPPLSLGTSERQ